MRKCQSTLTPRSVAARCRIWITGLPLVSLVPLAAIPTHAQDAPQQTNDEKLQELIKQAQELQAQVKALEAKQANAAATVPAAAPAPAPAPAPEPIAEEPAYTPPAGIKLRLFGDVGYTASDLKGAFGKYRPYFRYQYFNSGIDDPVYNNPEIGTTLGRRNGPSFGLRFDFNDHAAAKLQYDHFSYRGLETGNPRAVQTGNALGTEISFAH